MNVDEELKSRTLEEWCKEFGWQGGTIHEVKEKLEKEQKWQSDLHQFSGTEQYYKHWLGNLYTDGIKFLAEKAQAYWLLDAIFSYHRKEEFQLWELKVKNNHAVLTMKEDSHGNCGIKVRQEIEYTDFPIDYIKLYEINNVLMLTSEY